MNPEFLISNDTQQLFDLRKEKVMQIDECENEVLFYSRATFDKVYADTEMTIIPARRFFKALQKVQNAQLGFFTNLEPKHLKQ